MKTLFLHVSEVETANINRPASRGVVELSGRVGEDLPVAEKRRGWLLVTNEILTNDDDAHTGGPDVLLGAGVDHTVLLPVHFATAHVRTHIAHEDLVGWHLVKGEIVELNSVYGLIITVMEVGGFLIDGPGAWVGESHELSFGVRIDFLSRAVLLCLGDRCLRPGSRREVVRLGLIFQ